MNVHLFAPLRKALFFKIGKHRLFLFIFVLFK